MLNNDDRFGADGLGRNFIAIFHRSAGDVIIGGAIPGLTADIAIILCLPITYSVVSVPAMLLLLGLLRQRTAAPLPNFDQYTGYALERGDYCVAVIH